MERHQYLSHLFFENKIATLARLSNHVPMDLDASQESRELTCATLWKLNNEIILARYKDGTDLDIEDAVEVRDALIEVAGGRKFLGLVDARNMGGTLARKASDYLAKDAKLNALMMAQALVVNNLALILIARFYILMSNPISEAKIFRSLEEALDWLETKKPLLKDQS